MMAQPCNLLLLLLLLVVAPPAVAASKSETETYLRVYFHDIRSGRDPTAVDVARAAGTNSSGTSFGAVSVIDDPLTEGPDMASSRLVGRAQGMYVCAGKDSLSLLMAMNFVFVDGAYNGSSVAIFGPNAAASAVREMAVVGGTGAFRWARGYAQATTHAFDAATGDATVEYNVYLRH